jgi:hypothetical protein
VSSFPAWAIWSLAVAAVLSPVLAFLLAIAVEILIDALLEADAPILTALIGAGVIGRLVFRKFQLRSYRGASAET